MIKSGCCKKLKLKVAWKKDGFLFSLKERDTTYRISKMFHECEHCGYRTNIMYRLAKEENAWIKDGSDYYYTYSGGEFIFAGKIEDLGIYSRE